MSSRVMFIHIMKCGGTTLRHLLAEQYPREEIAPVPISPKSKAEPPYPYLHRDAIEHMQTLTVDDIAPYRLVMSHYDWRITRLAGEEWRIMTVLRDPVRQLMSRFYFIQKARDLHGREWERTCTNGFHYWLEHHAQPYANIQTKLLGLGDVQAAIDHIQDPRMVFGLVEDLRGSFKRFNKTFAWNLPSLPPRYNRGVVNTDVVKLSPDTIALARAVQHQDMQLYEAAVKLYEE